MKQKRHQKLTFAQQIKLQELKRFILDQLTKLEKITNNSCNIKNTS